MDITTTSLLAYKLAQGQQNVGMAMVKQAAQQDKSTANILEAAISPTGAADGSRGNNLDITV